MKIIKLKIRLSCLIIIGLEFGKKAITKMKIAKKIIVYTNKLIELVKKSNIFYILLLSLFLKKS